MNAAGQGSAAGVCIVGVAWQAAAGRLAPFLPSVPSPLAAGPASAALLVDAALDDAAAASPPIASRIYFVGGEAAQTRLQESLDISRAVECHATLADAMRAAAAALLSETVSACVVGAADALATQAAWLVLESSQSAASRGAAVYAEVFWADRATPVSWDPSDVPGRSVGWLELPGGAADAAAAQRSFSIPPVLLQQALCSAAVAPASGNEKGLGDTLALVRAALALGHRILPLQQPETSGTAGQTAALPLPWIQPLPHPGWSKTGAPRCAGWLATAADGRRAAIVLQEQLSSPQRPAAVPFAQQLFLFLADSVPALGAQLWALHQRIDPAAADSLLALADLAQAWHQQLPRAGRHRLALVVDSVGELARRLEETARYLTAAGQVDLQALHQPGAGRYCGPGAVTKATGATAFLFPGLGASYVGMLGDLCLHFPAVREVFDSIDFIAADLGESIVPSRQVFPLPGAAGDAAQSGAAVVTLLMAEWALAELLREFGIAPDVLMGCSTGEFAALCQAGAIDAVAAVPIFYRLSLGVERGLPREQLAALQSVLVTAAAGSLAALLTAAPGALYVSAELGPDCALLCGEQPAVGWLLERLDSLGIAAHVLASGVPYHTPLLSDSAVSSAKELQEMKVGAPRRPVWSCATAGIYAAERDKILAAASALFIRPIALGATVEAMYQSGVRTFIEVGPGDGLGRRVAAILRGRPHAALASNVQQRSGLSQLLHLLAALHGQGHSVDLSPLFRRSPPRRNVPAAPHREYQFPSSNHRGGMPRVRPLARLGTLLPALTLDLPHSAQWLCLRVDASELRAADVWHPQTLEKIFSPREQKSMPRPLNPEFLLRHLAAKRAMQELVRLRLRKTVELCELDLALGPSGELRAAGGPTLLLGGAPVIAVAACADAAVALAAPAELAFRIGMVITRWQSAAIADAQTALCQALAAEPALRKEAVHVAAADPGSGWITLCTPQHPNPLHARAFRMGSHVITRAVIPSRM